MPDEGPDLGSVSLTRNEDQPHATHSLQSPVGRGTLMVNLRAEADPEILRGEVVRAVADLPQTTAAEVEVLAAFRPGRPTPTHRVAEPVA